MTGRATLAALAALFCLGAAAPARAPAPPAWTGTWGAAPAPPALTATPRAPLTAAFADQTVRQVVRVSAGGRRVRVRLSNEYGQQPLAIGAARLALPLGNGGATVPGSDRVLTFAGSPTAVIPPGAPLLSDPVDMPVAALSSLAVSLYLPGETGPCTCHPVGAATGFVAPGDATAATAFPAKAAIVYRAFLTGVEVQAAPSRAVVVLGDSISDGTVSTPDANRRWPDRLAARLGGRWGVVNAGISGNRLLLPGAGESALARFDRDVLGVPGARAVIVLIGVNDLGIGYGRSATGAPAHPPTLLELQAGYRQIAERAHAHGLKVYGATITPFEGASYWSAQGDALRAALNAWIRAGGVYDGYVDFDAAWRDPAHPSRIREGLHALDHLHGSDAGYDALGDAVPLAWFR